MTLPPLNTPIAHDGSPECPVNSGTHVCAEERGHGFVSCSANLMRWHLVTTYTIIARAPADRIAELEAALSDLIQCQDGIPMTGIEATRRLERARATLKGKTDV